jgi:glycosyltransferase involved in cell wall biosynthesis
MTHRHVPFPTRGVYALWRVFGHPKVDSFLGGVEVYHATNYFLPPTKSARRVLSVHDVAFLAVPDLTSPKVTGIFSRNIRRFVHEADAVLTGSESTKSDLVRFLEVDPAKIRVTPYAVDEDFVPMAPDAAAAYLAKTYGIHGPFLLFVSTLEPRKNVPVLLQAFSRLVRELPHRLVLVGAIGWRADAVFETLKRLRLSDRVVHVGYVKSHAELPAFYCAADALVFPTLYEGFGFPILEAMRCGCPVITCRNSSVPEVAGEAALYVDAEDVDGIADSVRRVLKDKGLREMLVARGREQAQRFSWDRCAEMTLAVYRDLAGAPSLRS